MGINLLFLINYIHLKKSIFLFVLLSFFLSGYTQTGYWQQQVDQIIDVTLNDKEHTLDGFVKIEYFFRIARKM